MAGCSVIMMTSIFVTIVSAFVSLMAGYLLYAYIFESLFCARQCVVRWDQHPAFGWIPLWKQYLLGKAAGVGGLGIALALDHLAVLVLAVAGFAGADFMLGWLVVFVLLGMIIKASIACRVYQQASPGNWRSYNLGSLLTLGILRPVFLYLLREKLS